MEKLGWTILQRKQERRMMLITIQFNSTAPRNERFYAFWGENHEDADFWGSGSNMEDAVRDLIDNYDSPPFVVDYADL